MCGTGKKMSTIGQREPRKYIQFFTKMVRLFSGVRIASTTNGAAAIQHQYAKTEPQNVILNPIQKLTQNVLQIQM